MSGMRGLKTKKARKPRGLKQDGYPSMDLCECCLSYECNPMAMSDKFQDKISRRRREGRCVSCGGKECFCKSSSSIRPKRPRGGNVKNPYSDAVATKRRDKISQVK